MDSMPSCSTSSTTFEAGAILYTIAIPTYNRVGLLERSLRALNPQVTGLSEVEVLVSDNCSPDGTGEMIARLVGEGMPIAYIRNDRNIGADANVAQCFKLARGKYVQISGDDDILLEGSVAKILSVLRSGEYGTVFMNSYGFNDDPGEKPFRLSSGACYVYDDPRDFMKVVHFYVTFITAFIVNKSSVPGVEPGRFSGSNVGHLGWILPAITDSKKNAFIDDVLLACKTSFGGGHALVSSFGTNLDGILTELSSNPKRKRAFDIIRRRLVSGFFPHYLMVERRSGRTFDPRKVFGDLRKVFSRFPLFWALTVPAIFLPLPMVELLDRCIGVLDLARAVFKRVERLWLRMSGSMQVIPSRELLPRR